MRNEISPFLKGEARRQGVKDQQADDTALDALRRAQKAQEAHDRRIDVQLSLSDLPCDGGFWRFRP